MKTSFALPPLLAATAALAGAQVAPSCETILPYSYDSGVTSSPTSTVVSHRGAPWIQLDLSGTKLAPGARLLLVGEASSQELNASALKSFSNGYSAVFDGDRVSVTLDIPQPAVGGGLFRGAAGRPSPSRVVVPAVNVGLCDDDAGDDGAKEICGSDNRYSSKDVRIGRIGGCTGWMISEDVFLTAGHCDTPTTATRMHFTSKSGEPYALDQFAVEPCTWKGVDGGLGNDWAAGRLLRNGLSYYPGSWQGAKCSSGGGNSCGTSPPSPPSCMSGDTRVGLQSEREPKPVRDLAVGDLIDGLDDNMALASCSIEAIGHFGTGPVYGNYTKDHFTFDRSAGVVRPSGTDGEMSIIDKYAVLTSCPVGLDESGVGFTAVDSDFLGHEALAWSDYIIVHEAIVKIVREVGSFVFSPSTYSSMETVKQYTNSLYKTMLRCAQDSQDSKACEDFEKAAADLIDNALTKEAEEKVKSVFGDVGKSNKPGSLASVVSKGVGNDGGGVRGHSSSDDSPDRQPESKSWKSNSCAWFELGEVPGSPGNNHIRITGYGTDGLFGLQRPQQTNKGDLDYVGWDYVRYLADSMGGNSGGPIIHEETCTAIGIHTHGGCASGTRGNGGIRIDQPDLAAHISFLTKSCTSNSECPGGVCKDGRCHLTSGPGCPLASPAPSISCMSGDTRVGTNSQKEPKPVRDLVVGDVIAGLDGHMNPTSKCSIEAIGHFGTGPVFGNYTKDHFTFDRSEGVVRPSGIDGKMKVIDKYAVLTSCPVGVDEAGVGFTAVDSDFLGHEALAWSDYIVVHEAIVKIVREVGSFVFSPSTYSSMDTVKNYTNRLYKTMLKCAQDYQDSKACKDFEKAAADLKDNALTKGAKKKVESVFVNLGKAEKPGSLAAVVSKGMNLR